MSNDWSQLPLDLLNQIVDLLTLPDLIRFGYVCTSWQSVSTPSRHKGRLPWLIAPFKNNLPENSSTWIDSLPFYSVLDNIFYNLDLPEIIDRRICGSSNGWLMTVHENSDIQLLHPFSRKVIDLPSLLDMPGINGMKLLNGKLQYKAKYLGRTAWEDSCLIRDTYIAKAIISATPVPLVMVSNINDELIFCRPEIDYEWKSIENGMFGYNDVVYCEGKFYAVLFDGSLYVVEGLEGESPVTKLLISENRMVNYGYDKLYLVESSGDLLRIIRIQDDESKTIVFKIRKLNFEECKWVEVKSLGDRAIFVGVSYSYSLSASDFPGCTRNCIYFTEQSLVENRGAYDICIHNLEDGTMKTIYLDDSTVIQRGPIWYSSSTWYASMQGHH